MMVFYIKAMTKRLHIAFIISVIFLVFGNGLMYGQEQEETNTEEITLTLNFNQVNAYELKSTGSTAKILETKFKVQDITVSLGGYIAVYTGTNKYLRLSTEDKDKLGQIRLTLPESDKIKNISITPGKDKDSYLINAIVNSKSKSHTIEKNKTTEFDNLETNNIIFQATREKIKNDKTYHDAYISQITVTYTREKLDASFDEKDNKVTDAISDVSGSGKTVSINRIFNCNYLNTACFPFDLSYDKIKGIFGNGTSLYTYAESKDDEISFVSIKSDMKAGTPFIIKPEYYVEQPTFSDVTIEDTTPGKTGGKIAICGTIAPYEMSTDGSELFLKSDSTLVKPAEGKNKMRGFRCYIKTNNNEAQMPTAFFDGNTNSIRQTQQEKALSCGSYTITGTKERKDRITFQPGIFIIDGKKFLIKK